MKCLIENGIEYRKEWTIGDRMENGTLLTDPEFPDKMPTAFVCNCDETAALVIMALRSKGVRVPEDISVVGYDNYITMGIGIPAVTTMSVDLAKMAEISVDIIVKKLAEPSYTEGKRVIGGKLIIKNSVMAINGGGRDV